MIRIRYLTLLILFLGSIGSWAQNDEPFNPSSPDEPGPSGVPKLSLVADPVDGGTVTGAGWYNAGAQVTLRAYNKTNFVFDRWADSDGNTVSTSAQFKYTKKDGDETLTAYFRFSPGSPAEPTEAPQYYQLTLKAEDGGTVSGGGKYMPNTRVQLSASMNTGFVFDGWYDANNELISSTASFYYTTTANPVTLTARFRFDPSSPDEPPLPNLAHTITITAEEGGTVNTGGAKLKQGETLSLTATANAGYVFRGWYKGDELYNTNRSFTFTMGTEDVSLLARFTFNPSAPSEPSMPDTHKYAFYLMNIVTKPEATVKYPIYLTSLDELRDMAFQLTFPEELQPDLQQVGVSAKAEGYDIACEYLGENVYSFTMTGGTMPDGNSPVLMLTVPVPADIATAQNYQVKINQVTVIEADGTQTTASTRNGRISVYKNGDANGDNDVDIADAVCVVNKVVDKIVPVFIAEVANVDGDDVVDIADAVRIVNLVVGKIDALARQRQTSLLDPE